MPRGQAEADLAAEEAPERQRRGLDHGHRGAEAARAGRDLEADQPGADDRDAGAGAQCLAQPPAVIQRAQHLDVGEAR
jgi:hypothetical protein